jgi:hypothetical protein
MVCSIPECGREVRARGYCQTHYKHWKKTGGVRPIRPMRPRRLGAVRLGGLSVTPGCAEQVQRRAREHGWSIVGAIVDVLEIWARRQKRRT